MESAQQQFVSSAAICQLSCNLSGQLQFSSSAQLQTVNLAAHVQPRCKFQPAICRLGCSHSAQLPPLQIFSSAICHSSCISPAHQSVCYLVAQGSSPRAGPGQSQLPISICLDRCPNLLVSPAKACRKQPTSYLGAGHCRWTIQNWGPWAAA